MSLQSGALISVPEAGYRSSCLGNRISVAHELHVPVVIARRRDDGGWSRRNNSRREGAPLKLCLGGDFLPVPLPSASGIFPVDALRFHLGRAVENGVKEQELIEAITHLAFYSGWPNAMSAIMIAKELFSEA
ncbi:MAG: carboxymuconolactone decarboxylase family protein [Terriglobales bacterium]